MADSITWHSIGPNNYGTHNINNTHDSQQFIRVEGISNNNSDISNSINCTEQTVWTLEQF
jgi:hypothetical protein